MDNKQKNGWLSQNWKLIAGIFFVLGFIALLFFVPAADFGTKSVVLLNGITLICWNFYKDDGSVTGKPESIISDDKEKNKD